MIKTVFISLFVLINFHANAQYNTSVYNQYLDFNEAQSKNETAKAFLKADSILHNPEKLPAKAEISFFGRLAKLYEDNHQPQKAIFYNEKVIAAVPDYYVSHRALGYLYLSAADNLVAKINQSKANSSDQKKLQIQYFNLIKTALPHLEKAEACDHDEETMNLIKSLYPKINDQSGLASLPKRLQMMKANCVDLLTE